MSTEHLVLGEITDFVTGRTVVETHDEQIRQKIARFLVEQKGYAKEDIETQRKIELTIDGEKASTKVDFVLTVDGRSFAIIVFGPGSLVTRERSTLASARLVEDYPVPLAVITNGEDAEVLETRSGKVLAEGLEAIPSKQEALKAMPSFAFDKMPDERIEKEKRILFAFEVLAERECDEFTCSL